MDSGGLLLRAGRERVRGGKGGGEGLLMRDGDGEGAYLSGGEKGSERTWKVRGREFPAT